jgi:hypothetical protein
VVKLDAQPAVDFARRDLSFVDDADAMGRIGVIGLALDLAAALEGGSADGERGGFGRGGRLFGRLQGVFWFRCGSWLGCGSRVVFGYR